MFFLIPASWAVAASGVAGHFLVTADVAFYAVCLINTNGRESAGWARRACDAIVAKRITWADCAVAEAFCWGNGVAWADGAGGLQV